MRGVDIHIRPEAPDDAAAIRELITAAFGQQDEATLVDRLRDGGGVTLSLVAAEHARVLGHVLFSPVTVSGEGGASFSGVGLGPVAVLPELQRQGIGGRLIREGISELARAGHSFCVVLGDPAYYRRFGFERASVHGLKWEHPARDEAFRVCALRADGLQGVRGVVRYRPEFDGL